MSDGVDTVADLIRRDTAQQNAPAVPGNEALRGDMVPQASSPETRAAGNLSPAAPLSDEEALVRCLRVGSDRVRVVATTEGHIIRLKLAGSSFDLEPGTALGIGLALIGAATDVGAG